MLKAGEAVYTVMWQSPVALDTIAATWMGFTLMKANEAKS